MYKQILIPTEKNHSVEMPERFFGKKAEVIVMELEALIWMLTQRRPPVKKLL